MALYSREASNVNAIRIVNSKHKHMEMLFLDRLKVRGFTCAISFWAKRELKANSCIVQYLYKVDSREKLSPRNVVDVLSSSDPQSCVRAFVASLSSRACV